MVVRPKRKLIDLPKTGTSLVDGRTIRAWNDARFVTIMADNVGFLQTAVVSRQTIFFDMPFTHLLEIFFLVILVQRPTHVKQVGLWR